jgi:hypothetical protein
VDQGTLRVHLNFDSVRLWSLSVRLSVELLAMIGYKKALELVRLGFTIDVRQPGENPWE